MGFFKKTSDAPEPAAVTTAPAAPAAAPLVNAELIAVISAAIAAFEGGAAVMDGLTVRRIRRIQDQAPAWNRAGLTDCIDSRRM